MKYNYLINVVGLRRSGIHALIRWFAGHFNKSLFINDSSKALYSIYPVRILNRRTIGDGKVCGRGEPAEALILGHEECSPGRYIKKIKGELFQKELSKMQIGKFITILLIRDPYNNFASRTTLSNMVKPKYAEFYRPLMDEYNGKTSYFKELGNNARIVLYNNWFSDKMYRKDISKYFGLDYSDAGLNYMMPYGRGSSFVGMTHKQSAQQMDVLNRWRKLEKNQQFMQFFKDNPDIDEFSKKVFNISGLKR